jgi:hypothetical protein
MCKHFCLIAFLIAGAFPFLTLANDLKPLRHPDDPALKGVVIVSDFHLFDPDFDFESIRDPIQRAKAKDKAHKNAEAYSRMLGLLSGQPDVSAIVMNGDIFHAPTSSQLNPEVRIRRMIDILVQMNKVSQEPLYFNFGNHDIQMNKNGTRWIPVPGFAQKFEDALKRAVETEFEQTGHRPEIHLVGAGDRRLGDHKAVFEITIAGKKFRISHSPFASTDEIKEQARFFKDSNPRAYSKIVNPELSVNNSTGAFIIQSDSHTPAADNAHRVYNTGMLTVDESLPFPDSTFLVVDDKQAQHFVIHRDYSPASPYKIPTTSTLELFDKKGHPKGNIDKNTIHEGDILSFRDGTRFRVLSYLGQGNVNVIFKVQMIPAQPGVPDVLVLRLPLFIEGKKTKTPPQEYINSYIDGYAALEKQSISIPKKYKSAYGQYVASEFIESDFNGHDFFESPDALSEKYSPKVLQEAEEALIEFARTTTRFKNIGDFGPGQLVYNIQTKTWTFLDWFDAHKTARFRLNKQKSTPFNEGFESDLTVTTNEDGTPAGNRALTSRERRIIDRLQITVLAERKNLTFFRCLVNRLGAGR